MNDNDFNRIWKKVSETVAGEELPMVACVCNGMAEQCMRIMLEHPDPEGREIGIFIAKQSHERTRYFANGETPPEVMEVVGDVPGGVDETDSH